MWGGAKSDRSFWTAIRGAVEIEGQERRLTVIAGLLAFLLCGGDDLLAHMPEDKPWDLVVT